MFVMRRAHHLARFVLVWFALSLGVAVASPLVHPKAMDLVCTSSGAMKWVVVGDDSGTGSDTGNDVVKNTLANHHTLDCPVCASFSAPPPAASHIALALSPLAQALQPVTAARIAAATAPPLPSRGPPSLLS